MIILAKLIDTSLFIRPFLMLIIIVDSPSLIILNTSYKHSTWDGFFFLKFLFRIQTTNSSLYIFNGIKFIN